MKIVIKNPDLAVDAEAIVRFLSRHGLLAERIHRLHVTIKPHRWPTRWAGYTIINRGIVVYADKGTGTKELNRVMRHELGHYIEGRKNQWYPLTMGGLTFLIGAVTYSCGFLVYRRYKLHPLFLAIPLLVEYMLYRLLFELQYKHSPLERAAKRYEQLKDTFIIRKPPSYGAEI